MKKFDSINVIPFIDIMLVLLAIVLTTATFVASGHLDIALPKADGQTPSASSQPLEIAIDREHKIFFNGELSSLEKLAGQIEQNLEAPITLVIDESVPFSQFVSVIDLLKHRPMDKVSIRTRKSS
ncbi:MAG: ExbD/TolR family protein [Granulosicoccaceae bacterium]